MAIPATMVWEVNASGNDANGAGFDSAGTGTDRSQSTSPHVTFDGTTITATTGGTSATITITGYTVVSADVGNVVKIASGTNFTAGYYHISSVNTGANTWTLDRNCTSGAGSGMVGRMGGAAAAINTISNSPAVSGNIIYATGSFTITATITLPTGMNLSLIGYSSSRGDNGMATIGCSTNSVSKISISPVGNFIHISNITLNDTASTRGKGIACTAAFTAMGVLTMKHCKINGCSVGIDGQGTNSSTQMQLHDVWITSTTSSAILNGGTWIQAYGCYFKSSGADAVSQNNNSTGTQGPSVFAHCIFYNTTGIGYVDSSSINRQTRFFINCVFHTNSSDAIKFSAAAAQALVLINNLFISNGGYRVNFSAGANLYVVQQTYVLNNGSYNNTSGDNNFLATNNIALTGDPCTAPGSDNFALNNTAGAGAAARAAGFPGALQAGGTGYIDLGPLQHLEAAAGGMLVHPGMAGGMRG